MKKNNILILLAAVICLITSCEKFFAGYPEDSLTPSSFFQTEEDLTLYANGLINSGLPGATAIGLGEDVYSDFCGTSASKLYYYKDEFHPGRQGGWDAGNWSFLRSTAYFLENLPRAKDKVSEEKYEHYEGVGRFWRAYATFSKVKMFGDCFFIDHVLEPDDSTMLYGPRQSREYVMHKVTEDLKFACAKCLTQGAGIHTDSRIYINKYVALAFASRVFLYEGTYRKYHPANPSTGKPWSTEYESSEDFLRLAYEYAGDLIELKAFELEPDYRSLFTSNSLNTKEVIWGRSYSEKLAINNTISGNYCTATNSQRYSPTKDFIMMFLKTDGTPARGDISITEEFNGRDKRLAATVIGPGQKKKNQAGVDVDFAPNWTWTKTGYCWVKWVVPEWQYFDCFTAMPIIRYAEVLLNYAEAAEELGLMDERLWQKSIGELRKRAGVTSIYPGSASYTSDTFLRSYYSKGLKHPVSLSDNMLEIRRERATELMCEGDSRFDDLMRWRMGDLIVRRYDNKGWRGIYITEEEAMNGFKFNGTTYKVSSSQDNGVSSYNISSAVDGGMTLSNGTYGYLIYHYDIDWNDKMYLKPIPTTALNVNPSLGQNEGWQWN